MRADKPLTATMTFLQTQGITNASLCCALSGGADSVCLLYCLWKLQETLELHVSAVHVNHNLRGAESLRDENFCRQLCRSLSIPLTVISADVAGYQRQHSCSVELAARECRYAAFETIAADWIATAHTASDNLETLFHRLARGSSLHGLTAIPSVNGRFLRPLLTVTRNEVEDFLAQQKQDFVTDSTNLTDDYTRNRIRHQIVPAFRQLNPAIERTVTHTLQSLRLEDDYLRQQAAAAFAQHCTDGTTLSALDKLHPAITMRCLALLLERQGLSYDAPLLEKLQQLIKTGGKWNLSGQIYAVATPGRLSIVTIPPNSGTAPQPKALVFGENQLYDGFFLHASLLENESLVKAENVHGKFANFFLDYDKIKGNILLCPRQYGDKIRLSGRDFTASLKKLVQANVPKDRRGTLHTLRDAQGLIFAEYIGVADRVKPDNATKRILSVTVSRKAAAQKADTPNAKLPMTTEEQQTETSVSKAGLSRPKGSQTDGSDTI